MEFQTIIVVLIIAIASSYVFWQVYKKLRSTTTEGSCDTGCGKCKSK